MMHQADTIVVTGAAGFIASYLTGHLNRLGYEKLVLVDDFSRADKLANLDGKQYLEKVDREHFFDWAAQNAGSFSYVFHLGARTDTTEMDYEVHRKWNLEYSQKMWALCTKQRVPLLYASSAATYGNGEWGYQDDHDVVRRLQPLNPYGRSKNDFDIWALEQPSAPPFWAGVKFFNVYGPNEYHKGRMASVIFHAYNQIRNNGSVRLFRSHNPEYRDGEQMRDFVYVRDVADMCTWLLQEQPANGLYNIGSGKARTFLDLVRAIFRALDLNEQIEFVDTPADIRDKYQYFTEADMHKLIAAGYTAPLTSLEEGVTHYVQEHLQKAAYF